MKQLIVLVVMVMGIIGCTPNGEQQTRQDNNTQPVYNYRIVIIDGCEYIEVDEYKVYSLTHKGNCINKHTRYQ